ncbi:uncharacterized protein Z520_07536 [Fonsecaea multimorphosa CBS 102226]|uniref:Uncharacterized protein n=1 Tax=Fonsecaea multimorphosa CBS 102226 TaxID=1442371 RepID=A0A0D2IIF9_9EURO|nr:uncharacterized protein Z520_07536 [Fonsecaea multimorphosa CBS 102226]KIX96816.1 hypothetical protein Z520_07536 [Fonsecaea multimorphosa CBS 102226]OAL22496.1 hypothetical protein AYO22_07054 [Fonsecaea multimorphosa]
MPALPATDSQDGSNVQEAQACGEREIPGPRTQRPLTREQASGHTGVRYSVAQRVQTLTLLSVGFSPQQVENLIRVPATQARRIFEKATKRGYRPQEDLRILDHYVEDGVRTGRPKKDTNGVEQPTDMNDEVDRRVLALVEEDSSPGDQVERNPAR